MKTIKLFIVFLIVQSIIFMPAANASTFSGWTLGNLLAQGASSVVNATKTSIINGASVVKNSTAKITPTASQVAKTLAKGVAGYALSIAVEQLLGSVDWVLDPANNQIKYKNPGSVPNDGTLSPNYQYICSVNTAIAGQRVDTVSICGQSFVDECKSKQGSTCPYVSVISCKTGSGAYVHEGTCTLRYTEKWGAGVATTAVANRTARVDALPTDQEEEKTIPLELVAEKVISNAETGDVSAQEATTAAAADVVAEAEKDQAKARAIVNQLEANAETSTNETAQGQAKPQPNTETGEIAPPVDFALEFPKFCEWSPIVCEAAQTVITFPNTLTTWYETSVQSISDAWVSVKDWATSKDTDTETELEIADPPAQEIDTDLSFGGSCPDDRSSSINLGLGSIDIPISYQPICSALDTAKPVLIFVGFFLSALIVGGVRTE